MPMPFLRCTVAVVCALAASAAHAAPPNILLILADDLGYSDLGCYGGESATPTLDALANEGVRFDQAMSSVAVTLPSHATMFTGVEPPVHGVRYNGMFRLGDESVTIAELLRGAGFATSAVPSAFPVNAQSGLAQGFATYLDMFSEPGADKLPPSAERKAADVTRLGLETIRAAGKEPYGVTP